MDPARILESGRALPAKLTVPPAPERHVPRTRLHRLLRRGPFAGDPRPSVTLVCAPAGFGKTTLMASWTAHQPLRPRHDHLAWLTLDHTHNDPLTLWPDILTSLGGGDGPWLTPGSPSPHGAQQFVIAVEETARRRGRTCLVLDDVHNLHDPVVLRHLDLLIRYQPECLDLVLCSRTTPPLGLHRLSVEGRMWEVTAADLAFGPAQAAEVFACHGVRLSEADLRHVMTSTEGWPEGVAFLAEALASSPPGTEIESLLRTGSHMAGHLIAEVVAKLSPLEREVLDAISPCEHVSTALATALTGRADAGAVLERLAHRILLVTQWGPALDEYRCHGLLQSHLRNDLSGRDPAHLAALHRRAAAWYAGHGEPVAALQHAAHGRDPDLLAHLVDTQGLSLVLAGRGTALLELADTLPPTVTARPSAGLVLLLASLIAGDKASAERRLARLGTEPHAERKPRVRHLRTCVDQYRARLSGNLPVRSGETSDFLQDPDLGLLALVNHAAAEFAVGQHRTAAKALKRALGLATGHHWHYAALHCLAHLASVAAVDEDFPSVLAAAERALRYADEHDLAGTAANCLAHAVAGWAGYQTLDENDARRHTERATELRRASNDRNVCLAVHTLAAALRLDGCPTDEHTLRALREKWAGVTPGDPVPPMLVAIAAPIEYHAALRLHRADWAAGTEHRARRLLGISGDTQLMRAHSLARMNDYHEARRVLKTITAEDVRFHLGPNRIQAHLMAAVLAGRERDTVIANNHLHTALELAEGLRSLRPFATAGRPIRDLLAARAGKLGHHNAFAEEILAKTKPATNATEDTFTPRERQLLIALATPATTREMADELNVSVNTVKTHLRSAYRKLDARSRREAVMIARRNGLL
ncbi:LuxR C-terminal-related transcriptional regulator [Amycolatopsis alkalitolerans]|nr:LuxR C-terminal-related transcriptional regulator [Amycolatopsis alkalitolerans]